MEDLDITDDVAARMKYVVRRITPTECERLSGLPDGYTIPKMDVSDDVVSEFVGVFAEWTRITSPDSKPRSEKQVRAWLDKVSNPDTCPDSPRYKACGNGWAVNQPRWILMRMLASVDPVWVWDVTTASQDADHVGAVVVTNSNGDDVAPTMSANMAKLGGDNQTVYGGGTSCVVRSHNFEMYDNAENLSVSLNAMRAHDTIVYWKTKEERQ